MFEDTISFVFLLFLCLIDVTEVSDGVAIVSDGVTVVSDGARVVSDGVAIVSDGVTIVSDGVRVVSDGVTIVSDGVRVVSDGVTIVSDGVTIVSDGVTEVSDGVTIVSDGVTMVSDGVRVVSDGVTIVSDGVTIVFDGVMVVSDGVAIVSDGMAIVSDGVRVVSDGVTIVSDGVTIVSDGVTIVSDGVTIVSDSVRVVSGGVTIVSDGVTIVSDGVRVVSDDVTVVSDSVIVVSEGAMVDECELFLGFLSFPFFDLVLFGRRLTYSSFSHDSSSSPPSREITAEISSTSSVLITSNRFFLSDIFLNLLELIIHGVCFAGFCRSPLPILVHTVVWKNDGLYWGATVLKFNFRSLYNLLNSMYVPLNFHFRNRFTNILHSTIYFGNIRMDTGRIKMPKINWRHRYAISSLKNHIPKMPYLHFYGICHYTKLKQEKCIC